MFYDDHDVPAGYRDADILQAQYEAESRAAARDRAAGICHHSSQLGHREPSFYSADDIAAMLTQGHFGNRGGFTGEQSDIGTGMTLCTECGEVMPDPFADR